MSAKRKSRQQKRNVKARKAKARAAHQAQYRSWLDRRKARLHASSTANAGFGQGLAASAAMMSVLAGGLGRGPTISERLLCEVMGEEFRP